MAKKVPGEDIGDGIQGENFKVECETGSGNISSVSLQKAQCKRCVVILSIALMLLTTSYVSLESLQSSLNHTKGTTALSLMYVFYMLSSLLLPPLVITRLKCRKTLALGIFSYTIYIIANFYPKPYVLASAAVILGLGSGLLWATTVYYIIRLSLLYAKLNMKKLDFYTKHFFGIIYSMVNFGSFTGAIIMSVLLTTLMDEKDTQVTEMNVTTASEATTIIFNKSDNAVCGLYHTFDNEQSESEPEIRLSVLYVLLTVYVVLSAVGSILCLFLTDPDDKFEENDKVELVERNPINSNDETAKTKTTSELEDISGDTEPSNGISLLKKDNCDAKNNNKPAVESEDESNFSLVKSTARLLLTDKAALLFITHTGHVGMLKAFYRSTFNAAWISCGLGIQYVGYAMAASSCVLTVVSYLSGPILSCMSHRTLFALTMLVEISICTSLMLWIPGPGDTWAYLFIMILFASCYGIVKTQTPSAYSTMFTERKKAGAAMQTTMEAFGLSLMFALSGFVYPITSMFVFVGFSVLGYSLWFIASLIKDKDCRYWGNRNS